MKSCVIGIDGGASKTLCVVLNHQGQILGRGEADASNYHTVGIKTAFASIESAIRLATQEASAKLSMESVTVEAICLGLAGVGRPRDREVVRGFVQQLLSSQTIPVTWALLPSTVVICDDALIALVGGVGKPVGVVAIAGTGSIVFGRNAQGNTKRVGGWGHILGDVGSAYHIAVSGLRAAINAYDGCAVTSLRATSLQERFTTHFNLSNFNYITDIIYQPGWGVKEIASLAPIVDQAAAEGDQVAISIIEDTVNQLAKATQVVIESVFTPDSQCEVVTTGSVWHGLSSIRQQFESSLVRLSPNAKVIWPRHEPAYGAGLLGLRSLGNRHASNRQ
ncbi:MULTISPECIES: BadF/BadG/BcrA/BcrD ATPase family protein [unclassified Moorena]|uniref:N-acetylglucosamine kinase n=1 Tax=unclassified Moorena TaxID=2683338 RepID=UPI001400930E|nr:MULTISPECIES: BadF/BadG/BcrA/BcrD ATPase family protein [unclassified Moorena]NEO16145.1 ATPase [Moorena sp. SIO3E8]NEQ02675.1 ATPase [Moorena sp. SIO3F7]